MIWLVRVRANILVGIFAIACGPALIQLATWESSHSFLWASLEFVGGIFLVLFGLSQILVYFYLLYLNVAVYLATAFIPIRALRRLVSRK